MTSSQSFNVTQHVFRCSDGNDFLLNVVRHGAKWNATYLDAGGEGAMAGTPEKAPA